MDVLCLFESIAMVLEVAVLLTCVVFTAKTDDAEKDVHFESWFETTTFHVVTYFGEETSIYHNWFNHKHGLQPQSRCPQHPHCSISVVFPHVQPALRKPSRVVGCGIGSLYLRLNHNFFRFLGVFLRSSPLDVTPSPISPEWDLVLSSLSASSL